MKTYKTLAVCSGKGGVGKSTVSFYLAQLLQSHDLKVGLIDADVYGPSLHLLFDNQLKDQKPELNNHKYMAADISGIKFMSSAFIAPGGAFIRAPKATAICQSFFDAVDWGDLDILIVDFPPGTGDIALSLFQEVVFDGALVITSPHTLSVEDSAKSCLHLQKSGIEILGVIENMSYMTIDDQKLFPFGQDGARELAEIFNVDILAKLPLIDQGACQLSTLVSYLHPVFNKLVKKLFNRCQTEVSCFR